MILNQCCKSIRVHVWMLLCLVTLTTVAAQAQEQEKKYNFGASLDLGIDLTAFFQSAAYEGQEQFYPGIFARPKFALDWDGGNSNIIFEGFGRWDINGNSRSHWDVRELYYQYYQGNWEFNAGVKKVFWGKTEGVHLVDVINQIDFLEGIDGEEKLGQPMVQVSYSSKYGVFTGFALPYSREIAFGNEAGRPRTPQVITDEQVSWESDREEWHPTFAMRWSHFIGDSDIGLHYFYGNARDPLVLFSPTGEFGLQYPVVHQLGLDYQVIVKSTILKLESIFRAGDFADFENIFAITGGLEYTFGNVNKKGLDIGLIAEYVYDNRQELTFSSLDNDIFLGSRFAFNNVAGTEVLFGIFQDISKTTRALRLEGSQRIGNNWKFTATGQAFVTVDEAEFVYLFRRDSFLELELVRYF